MNELFNKLKNQFLEIWGSLNKIHKVGIGVIIASLLIFIVLFSVMSTRIDFEPLFSDMEAKDAAMIKANLDKKGVEYKISQDGRTIEVPKDMKYSIRLDLSKEGVVPDSTVGFEIFDTAKIGATEFDKKMMFLRAQKGELEKTIKSLSQVKKAVVNITPANDSPFAEEKTSAKASILIQLEAFETLSEENIKSIIVLVAGGIEGLSKDNVEIVDSNGNILSDRVDFSDEGEGASRKKIELQKEIEKKLERNANGVLSVLGSGNYRVKVSVDLDFNRESYQQEIYTTPTVSGEQLTSGLIRSEQKNGKEYNSEIPSGAEGVPGTTSNIPGYVAEESSSNNGGYKEASSILNYELDRKNSVYEKSVGAIDRMTVSVNLNKDAKYFKDMEEVTPEEISKFENMVKTAVGFNDARGDRINVTVIPFNFEFKEQYDLQIRQEEKWQKYQVIAGLFIIVALITSLGAYILFRKLEHRRLKEREEKAMEDLLPQLDDINLEEELSIEEQERVDQENQIKQIALQKPEEVATLIRNWMAED